jgi:hypothetical protein
MSKPEDPLQAALIVLNNYYTRLAMEMAADILDHYEDFFSTGFGNQVDDLIEKHAHKIHQLNTVYSTLRWKAYRKKPEGKAPLGKYDFRCFGCGGVIQSIEDACSLCGWTWH